MVRILLSVDPGTESLGRQPAPRAELAAASGVLATFTPVGLTTERALIVCELYRRGAGWRVRAVGQGYDGGLPQALIAHGIDVVGLRLLGQAGVGGGAHGVREGVCGQPTGRDAEHRHHEGDGDEHEDDVRNHAADPTAARCAYSGCVAGGVLLDGAVGGRRTPPRPPAGVSAGPRSI